MMSSDKTFYMCRSGVGMYLAQGIAETSSDPSSAGVSGAGLDGRGNEVSGQEEQGRPRPRDHPHQPRQARDQGRQGGGRARAHHARGGRGRESAPAPQRDQAAARVLRPVGGRGAGEGVSRPAQCPGWAGVRGRGTFQGE